MVLPVDVDSDEYRLYKGLNEDIKLVTDEYKIHYDISFDAGDVVNVQGFDSLVNACCIAIMTRFDELERLPHYDEFGNKAHRLIKKNKNQLTRKTVEDNCDEVLKNIRRIKKVNFIEVTTLEFGYLVEFSVTSINDQQLYGDVVIGV